MWTKQTLFIKVEVFIYFETSEKNNVNAFYSGGKELCFQHEKYRNDNSDPMTSIQMLNLDELKIYYHM